MIRSTLRVPLRPVLLRPQATPTPTPIHIAIRRSSNSAKEKSYSFNQAISDLNLKWTIPLSLAISLGLWFYIQDQLPSQPKPLKIDPSLPPLITLDRPALDQISDPSTGLEFPAELLPDHLKISEPLRLVGLGVRTVSFLAVKVYVAGFYVDPRALRALRVIPGWNDDLNKDAFLAQPAPASTQPNDRIQGAETLIGNLLTAPVNFAIRIAPVRPTDFTHLRDGFCRSLQARIERAAKAGTISEIDAEKASQSITVFRSFFPTGVSVPKGKALTIVRTSSQKLMIEYDGKKLGELDDSMVANQLMLAYFADKDPISPKLKESVADGFAGLYAPAPATDPQPLAKAP